MSKHLFICLKLNDRATVKRAGKMRYLQFSSVRICVNLFDIEFSSRFTCSICTRVKKKRKEITICFDDLKRSENDSNRLPLWFCIKIFGDHD